MAQLTYDVVRYIKSQRLDLAEQQVVIDYYESIKKKLFEDKTVEYEGKQTNLLELFNMQPASTVFHGAFAHGLDEHCFNMFVNAIDRCGAQTEVKVDMALETCARISLLHDLCKVRLYHWNSKENKYEADKKMQKHHATLSINMCLELGIELSTEEMSCIRHHMNSWDNKEDYVYETAAELRWRKQDKNSIKCDMIRWADMKDNYPQKVYAIIDDKTGKLVGTNTYTSKRHVNTLVKKNQSVIVLRIV